MTSYERAQKEEEEEGRKKLDDALREIYMWSIVAAIIALLWLWAHDWDVRCLFIECRRLL